MEINQVYHGFKLINLKEIKELGSVLYEFIHEKSGASLVYLANDDTNKCFSIGFRTLPEDSTGICHIIEHSVLCGSKKYPVKEPFVNLLKGSMASFLNAMTASDCTIYPVASPNDKDFNKLKVTVTGFDEPDESKLKDYPGALENLKEIGERYGFSQNRVSVILHRTRKKLLEHLKNEGFCNE